MTPLERLATLEGLITPRTGIRLATLAAEVSPNHAIVELGSYKGKSTCYLASGAKTGRGAHVFAFDAWDLPGNIGGKHGYTDVEARTTFDRQVREMGLGDRITARKSFSRYAAIDWNAPVGMLFIDADHGYESVRDDFLAWREYLVDGAVVAFDDFQTARNPGVEQFVNELMAMPWGEWDFETPPLAIAINRT